MKKNLSILIPNATSAKNIGDAAMLTACVSLLQSMFATSQLIIHTFNPELYNRKNKEVVTQTLYSWAVFSSKTLAGMIVRVAQLMSALLWIRIMPHSPLPSFFPVFLRERFADFDFADVVVMAPGGYIRSQSGVTQALNLFMQFVPLYIAKMKRKTVIVAPISAGPFAYHWQETFAVWALRFADHLFVREEISRNVLSKYGVSADLAYDMALSLPQKIKKQSTNKPIVGFVIRQWFANSHKQHMVEQSFVAALELLSQAFSIHIQPIVHVNAPEYGDNDLIVTRRIVQKLETSGVRMKPLVVLHSLSEAQRVYSHLDLLLSMRLHGAIIAAVEGVPSVVVGYEHKAMGIFTMLGFPELVVPIETLSPLRLAITLFTAWKKRRAYQKTLGQSLHAIHKKEQQLRSSFSSVLVGGVRKNMATTTFPTVTVAISAYNEEQNIKQFIASVLSQKHEGYALKSIQIISDGSTDRTVERARQIQKSHPLGRLLTITHYRTRKGKSIRLNELYRGLSTEYLIQSDADVIWDNPLLIRDLVTVMENNPRIGMCGGNPLPLPAKTFIEQAVNSTVEAYVKLRSRVRGGNNAFSADGRLLAFRKAFASSIRVPHDMIANDRYTYYVCKTTGWDYAFVPSAVVHFRSPETLSDHIRQNTRFVAAPIRMRRYFPESVIKREESIPFIVRCTVFFETLVSHPVHLIAIMMINRYCEVKAIVKEKRLTALWDIAYTTKKI